MAAKNGETSAGQFEPASLVNCRVVSAIRDREWRMSSSNGPATSTLAGAAEGDSSRDEVGFVDGVAQPMLLRTDEALRMAGSLSIHVRLRRSLPYQ
jgi:hypothetical protein